MKYGEKGWSLVKEANPVVEINTGKIKGFNRNGNGVFLGIPYGDNCDGEYRFKEPRPALPWDGIWDCTRYGPIAMQEQGSLEGVPEPVRKILLDYGNHFTGGIPFDKSKEYCDENCLVLNVVTPGVDEKKRPVMVYIHGGGYTSGSGAVIAAICDSLVDEEDVVIVTVNHRLNIFGGLYLGEFDEAYANSGIVGQLDLVMALQWVKNNIQKFGGDPANVTLIGESGGGIKIGHLMAMPDAKGLFSKAINISGSIPIGAKTKEQGTAETLKVLEQLGIAKEDWRKLLELPAETITDSLRGLRLIQEDTTPFYPTPDGVHIPFNVERDYKAYAVSAEVPLLVGASEEELHMDLLKNPKMTWENVRTELLNQEFAEVQSLKGLSESNVDTLIQTFRNACNDQKHPWQILVQIVSMRHFLGGGAYKSAIAKAGQKTAPVWHYMTSYDTPIPGVEGLACAWHTAELPLIFRAVYHEEAEKLSRLLAHSFASFARTDSPETDELDWPEFTMEDKKTMLFDEKCTWKYDPYKTIHDILAVF
ncbi:carboxylesterase family protein [Paenibacillus sp. E222]|uniref:carboxylesterase/lipase family protein n=1 Tax=Paenibacillus sp. E222 TaxID=2748863 RepID=UPI0015C5BD5A|nr:carboxylesterase family protein [Paenibacillus sp. E222]QLG40495.1 carboxylesterase family protein [Paenibacillus sp. E222]